MQQYSYTGRNKQGKLVKGLIESTSKQSIIASLKKDGIIPITIEEVIEPEDVGKHLQKIFYINIGAPSLTDLILFSRQMHSLTRAGVPIIKAINSVKDSVKNEKLKDALKDISTKLEGGQELYQIMNKHKDVFPEIMISLVEVGENTGKLDAVFEQAAVHLAREDLTKKQIKSAMRYPIIVIATIFVAVGIINVLVVPAFANFFSKFKSDLPLPTRILIASSNFTMEYWYIVLLFIISCVVGVIIFLRTDNGRLFWDRYKLKLPIIGSIISRALLARFSRSFALTSRTGVPLLNAIDIIKKTTGNVYVSDKISIMKDRISKGETLTEAAKESGMFSQLVMQMISIGEETGEVDKLLDEIGNYYEEELEYDLKKLSEAIEPILITIVAAMVLVLALGVFLPMWDIASVALKK